MVIRGVTPTLKLKVPESIDLGEAKTVYATFKQGSKKITKSGQDLDINGNVVGVYLTQEETLAFGSLDVEVQLNWIYNDVGADGKPKRNATRIKKIPFDRQLLDEVLS